MRQQRYMHRFMCDNVIYVSVLVYMCICIHVCRCRWTKIWILTTTSWKKCSRSSRWVWVHRCECMCVYVRCAWLRLLIAAGNEPPDLIAYPRCVTHTHTCVSTSLTHTPTTPAAVVRSLRACAGAHPWHAAKENRNYIGRGEHGTRARVDVRLWVGLGRRGIRATLAPLSPAHSPAVIVFFRAKRRCINWSRSECPMHSMLISGTRKQFDPRCISLECDRMQCGLDIDDN